MLVLASADSDAAITAAIVAAAVAVAVSLIGFWITGVSTERARRRELYADALAAVAGYREFAYVVRRRRHDDPAGERVRISEAMREVQHDLSRFEALMKVERALAVATAYRQLVIKTRQVAGGYISAGWNAASITRDEEMNISDVNYASLTEFDDAYLAAVARDLAWWRFWR